jgi:hypothetical protein|tara:strand:- start:759 stop:941 length:183 start_codon:yes stop_codon:yes gene_type:complete
MLSIGVLFTSIGLILILFNTIAFSFIKDQVKNKKQALLGFTFLILGVVLLIISIRNLMLE